MGNELQYSYAVGRIRALEGKLLDRVRIERMLDAKSAEEVIRILSETEYAVQGEDGTNVTRYEEILSNELRRVYRLLKDISPEKDVFKLFLYKYDIHNIKVLLKAEFLNASFDRSYDGRTSETSAANTASNTANTPANTANTPANTAVIPTHMLIDAGTIPVGKLVEIIRKRDFREMPEKLIQSVLKAIELFNTRHDPQDIDLELDRGLFGLMLKTAEESGYDFLKDMVKVQIDLNNIRTFFRLKRIKNAWSIVDKAILKEGSINKTVFTESLGMPLEDFLKRMKNTPYRSIIEAGVEEWLKNGTMTLLEKLSDDYLTRFAGKARYVTFGIEPLIGYLMAKENEIKVIRMIMVGKMNRIPQETIRERLRIVYG